MSWIAKSVAMTVLWTAVLFCVFGAGQAHAEGSSAWIPLLASGVIFDFVYEVFR